MNRPVRVGIVDSGAREALLGPVEAAAGFVIQEQQLWQIEGVDDRLGHGSMVLEIIQALAPDSHFVLAQVFHERFSTTASQVAAAIDWLVAQQVEVINLSLGLRQDRPALRAACERALSAGVLLCASSPARGEPVFPAAYPGVFRMTGDARCARTEVSHLATEFADFGGHVRPLNDSLGASGASMGCAHLCGHLARYLGELPPSNTELPRAHARLLAARDWLIGQSSYQGPEQRR
ncbi:peptidase S8/S53 subtilisin kexin sedolisin [Marinobacterium aestuarii]|uniref:Peptidase S8/S53 subtilisin kexin sedolisin n=1 Tax=Marinobacterium aestuarii TaxID=1821621 RepID=A0A1A9EZX7_9GAMM|nr:S8 family serine peptidase [Marinobacterium aestuarii]ANG63447.1 peptidase S8/S53 subtilisin kexin sedolisin [Marinobacterium aestuarii]